MSTSAEPNNRVDVMGASFCTRGASLQLMKMIENGRRVDACAPQERGVAAAAGSARHADQRATPVQPSQTSELRSGELSETGP
jgi:hypothetical protein